MTMPSDQFNFIWNLVSLSWLKQELNSAKQLAASIYDQNICFPSEIESLVVKYSVNGDEESLNQLALRAAQKFSYATEEEIQLVALLVFKQLINVRAAVALLASLYKSEKKLNVAEQHVVDVVWLLAQDEKDGVMQIEQDDLLFDAFGKLLKSMGLSVQSK